MAVDDRGSVTSDQPDPPAHDQAVYDSAAVRPADVWGPQVTPGEEGKPPTRRQLAAEQTRHKILTTALDQFSRRPYGEVTVGEIARSAGVAHGLLSHHFQGKDGLYTEVLREAIRQLRCAQHAEPEGPPGVRVRQRLHTHLDHLAGHQNLAFTILAAANAPREALEVLDSARAEDNRTLCELLGLPAHDPALTLALRSFNAAFDNLSVRWLRLGRPFDIDRVTAAGVELLAGAIQAARALNPELDVTAALSLLSGTKPLRQPRRP